MRRRASAAVAFFLVVLRRLSYLATANPPAVAVLRHAMHEPWPHLALALEPIGVVDAYISTAPVPDLEPWRSIAPFG